jgi:hypothetical protein
MELEQARDQALRLALSAVEQEELAETARRHAAAMRKIVAGYLEMFPELRAEVEEATGRAVSTEDDEESEQPRGAEAVRLILQDSPNAHFSVSELVSILRDRGWLPKSENPANAIRTALERLCADAESDVYKHRYRLASGNITVQYAYEPDRERDDFGEEPF